MTTTTQTGIYTQKVPPSTRILTAMINSDGMTLRVAINEQIANAIEQDAKKIEMWLDRANDLFLIKDDGNGCPDLKRMTVLGEHYHTSDRQKISRYGVGLKDATVWMGQYLFVHSMCLDGKKEWMTANWTKIIQTDWEFSYKDGSDRTSHGVTFKVQGLRPNRFQHWRRVPEWIAQDFSTAIKAGIEITVDGLTVTANPDPELTDRVPFSGTYAGLKFDGFCGILKDRKKWGSGWEVCYGPLVIERGYQKEGFGKYSPQGFFGRLNLVDGDHKKWTLSRNKTGAEELGDILNCPDMQDIVRPILEKLKTQHQTLNIKLNQANVQIMLNEMLHRAQVKLSDTETEEGGTRGTTKGGKVRGRVRAQGTTRTRKKREEDQNSKIKERINRTLALVIDFHESPDVYGLGYVDVTDGGKLVKIYIDKSKTISQAIWGDNQLLLHHVVGLLAEYFTFGENGTDWIVKQMRLFADETEDCKKCSKVLLFLLENAIELQPSN